MEIVLYRDRCICLYIIHRIWETFHRRSLFCVLLFVLGSKNDEYAIWCPRMENHLPGIAEAANVCLTFEVIIHHPLLVVIESSALLVFCFPIELLNKPAFAKF